MNTWLPPVFRGKIPTTSGRLLAAVVLMSLCDLVRFGELGMAGMVKVQLVQVLLLIAVLLFSPRRWVALALALLAGGLCMPALMSAEPTECLPELALDLIPLLIGVVVAYPRRRRRVRWVEVDDEEDASGEKGAEG